MNHSKNMSQKFVKLKTSLWKAGIEHQNSSDYTNTTSFVNISLSHETLSDIIQIDSGFTSMIALTRQGNVYGRGKNRHGELGLGDNNPRDTWTLIPFPFKVKQVALKWDHSLFLTEEGHVYSCGANHYGQLGFGHKKHQNILQCIPTIKNAIQVVSGIGHFSFVLCKFIQDAIKLYPHGTYKVCSEDDSMKNSTLYSHTNTMLYSNDSKSMLCEIGVKTTLYAFGDNECGKLGISRLMGEATTPMQIEFFNNKPPIRDIKAGCTHAVVLLQDGSLYAMGERGTCGRVWGKCHFHYYEPTRVPIGTPILSICTCSGACTIVQSINNEYYAFGNAERQTLPAYGKHIQTIPERIDNVFPVYQSLENLTTLPNTDHTFLPNQIQVKKLVSSLTSFFLLMSNNDLYVVGKGSHGEMGIANCEKLEKWTFCKSNIADVQASPFNSFIFVYQSFLFYEHQMKYTDVFICF